MATLPKIATCPPMANLITTDELRGAYERASIPKFRETATRALFEEFFNEYFRSSSLSVYGGQQLDDSQQAVDITLGFHDRQAVPNLVFVLLDETKRNKVKDRGELESQLQEYGDRYLSHQYGGLAMHHKVYGATAYGTKIRFFKFSREEGIFSGKTYSGELHVPDEGAYWDLKTDGILIHRVLMKIWKLRQDLVRITGV